MTIPMCCCFCSPSEGNGGEFSVGTRAGGEEAKGSQ